MEGFDCGTENETPQTWKQLLPERIIGQPLYRYRLSPEKFEQIETKLRTALSVDTRRFLAAPAFCLWASDWFRRSYQGGRQRWRDIGNILGVDLPQSEWRDITDRGFQFWGIEPCVTGKRTERLANLARQGGFPVAAVSSGASWPKRFLERTVGELLGSNRSDFEIAFEICERNGARLPGTWRSDQMYAICGELTFKIVELRAHADKKIPADGRPYSTRLSQIDRDWRDELPMMLDGAAGSLIDTLLEAKKAFWHGEHPGQAVDVSCARWMA